MDEQILFPDREAFRNFPQSEPTSDGQIEILTTAND
jgi:hypothetical protein